ncbi:hypothetical protein EWM64_g5382 [Hericium alpestre]|uniref:NAD-dependent epimerase/dehydratase domain-containing protein n=1 Tax=Hericium alpestre TaxID=135208 RepID=A0A4Y9ZUR7_9AGAM|nr:hypothetical protein EWM64_g5382 [Hericium alpestre]
MSILVTGANGFLASHIVDQLLDAGHRVRGSVRSGKEDGLRSAYASYGEKFEVVVIDDIATSDLEPAFQGVRAVIHSATAIPQSTNAEHTLEVGAYYYILMKAFHSLKRQLNQTAIDGTRHILRAARAANVRNVVVTSSLAALFVNNMKDDQKDATVDENSWNPLTMEDALQPGVDPVVAYGVSKKLSEQVVWQFANDNPDIDVVTVVPPWCIGPISPHSLNPAEAVKTYSNQVIYSIINGFEGRPFREFAEHHKDYIPVFVHISDIGRAHVLALESAPSSTPKRVLVSGGYLYLSDAVRHIATARPQLRHRLPATDEAFQENRGHMKVDASSASKILGMRTYKSWQETVEETVDDILRVQGRN